MTGDFSSKKVRAIALALVLQFLAFSVASPTEASVASVSLLSHSGYFDSIGFYNVVGEVQNSGNIDLNVQVTASLYDSSNRFVTNASSPTSPTVLLAGRTAPFLVTLTDPQQSSLVDHYVLSLAYNSYTASVKTGLQIVANSTSTQNGWMHITGKIVNNAAGIASSTKVIATYYNITHGVVATAFAPADPVDIRPGQQASFDIPLSPDRTPLATNYSLTAESANYALTLSNPYYSVLTLTLPTAEVGRPASLGATLLDENKQPIPGGPVEFSVKSEGSWKSLGFSTTSQNGASTLLYMPNVAGAFEVKASYQGGQGHSSASDTAQLRVAPVDSQASNLDRGFLGYLTWGAAVVLVAASLFTLYRRRRRKSQAFGGTSDTVEHNRTSGSKGFASYKIVLTGQAGKLVGKSKSHAKARRPIND